MAKQRYIVTEGDGFGGTDVYDVEDIKEEYPYKHASVWVSLERNTFHCTSCSGPLQAMLSNCPHANATRRYLAKKTRNDNA